MSVKIMTMVWDHGPDATTERFLLLALADHANDYGECWPSIALLAEKCCISERHAKRCVKALTESGYLEIDYQRGGTSASGRGLSNRYRIIMERLAGTGDLG